MDSGLKVISYCNFSGRNINHDVIGYIAKMKIIENNEGSLLFPIDKTPVGQHLLNCEEMTGLLGWIGRSVQSPETIRKLLNEIDRG